LATKPRGETGLSATQIRAQAYAEERAGRIWRAIALLQDAVERGPDDWTSLRKLADLLTHAGQPVAANEHYRRLAQNCELDQLHTQAIAVWKRILSNEPQSASAHLKLGELYALAGLRADSRKHYEAALAGYRQGGRAREVAQIEARLARLDEGSGSESAASAVPPLSPEQAAGLEETPDVTDAEFVKENLLQARLFRRYGLLVQARARLDALLVRFPDHPEGRRELDDLLREAGLPAEARGQEPTLEAPRVPSALEAKPAPSEPTPSEPAPAAPVREAWDEAGHQIGRDDYETRFNLGVAYREMGLLDEAIAELQLAAADEARLVECASMLAQCFVEQEKPARAVRWLEKGLATPGLPAPRRRGLQYDLAAAYEAWGEASRALAIYSELQAEDAGFRDVEDKVRRLSKETDPPPPGDAR
jgi:tetratricopeptide (TPR) repeat protein